MKFKLTLFLASFCLFFSCSSKVEKDLHTNITNSNILVDHINGIKDTFALFLDDKATISDIEIKINAYDDTYQKILLPYFKSSTSKEITPLQNYLQDATQKAQLLVDAINKLIRVDNEEGENDDFEAQASNVESSLKDFTDSFEELTIQQMQFAEKNEITSVDF